MGAACAAVLDNATGERMNEKNRDVLTGWQEIADYMNKSVRTCLRYSKTRKMPVFQPAGPGTEPYARKNDLDNWRFSGGTPSQIGA
jgi:hypothetical protein